MVRFIKSKVKPILINKYFTEPYKRRFLKVKEIKADKKSELFDFGESLAKDMLQAKIYEFDLEFPKSFTLS